MEIKTLISISPTFMENAQWTIHENEMLNQAAHRIRHILQQFLDFQECRFEKDL